MFLKRLSIGLSVAVMGLTLPSVRGADMTLEFSKDHTLKGLFDAGMRPYREPHAERFQVGAERITAQIQLPSGVVVGGREWQSMRFSVVNDGRLTSGQMRSLPLTLDEAKAAMLPLLSMGSGESPASLDAFLEKVKAQPLLYEGEFHVATGKRQNPMFIAAFSRTGLKETPLALRVNLEWQIEPKSATRAFYKEPIPPPPGYESVSMEKPPYPGSVAGTVPLTTPTPAGVAPTPALSMPRPSASPTATVAAEKPAEPSFPVVPVAILAVLIVAAIAFFRTRCKPE